MFFLKEPSDEEVRQFLSAQGMLPFSYGEVGASREDATADLPPGYAVYRYRMKLGEGIEVYARAVEVLRRWRQFELGWGYDSSRQGRRSRSACRWASSPGTPASGR
jgi:hypothetical protein